MSLALSYSSDFSRVQVELSGLPDGTVQVQRALNTDATDAIWQQAIVRGAEALPVESGAQVDDYEFFADVANYYRTVPVDPAAGLLLTGDSGDHASTPDHSSLDITGDITLEADVILADWASGSAMSFVSKYLTITGGRSYELLISAADNLQIFWSEDGSSFNSETSTVPPSTVLASGLMSVRVKLKADDGEGNHRITFEVKPSPDGPWQQLGDQIVNSGTTSIHNSSTSLFVGSRGGTSQMLDGTVVAARVWSGDPDDGGTLVASPDFAAEELDTTSFDDSEGRTWSVNGDARINGTSAPEDITPSLEGRVWLKSITYPFLNRPLFRVLDRSDNLGRGARAGVFDISGRSAPVEVSDLRRSRSFTVFAQVEDGEHAAVMDLVLAAGGPMFIHSPPGSKVPGGYVSIGDTSQHRRTTAERFVFALPCQVVAPPSPEVVGTLLTWGTVLRLYGSWQAVVSAHPTWASLLATVGDPDDLVVI